ncbi:tape measure protein [Enterococcus casseliflavus]|uniref:tape measure protein n=1 Tax=Enterococcus casseliflavus TaxID=37734 RepID=UPI001432E2C5|nr:tape measure protein [Enterococcus casseliflavus]NKD29181.1 tape measure protein [Enterococcus casseliflavus]
MADGKIVIAVDVDGNDVTILNKNLDQLEGKSSKAGASIKNMAISMGLVKVAGAAFKVLSNSLDSAISRFDTMQKFPKVMNALGFSAKQSQKSIDKLSDGIDGLPTKLDDVVASTQQMTAITGDLDKSTDTVLALNNAFLASGASTDDASRGMQQFNQMLSTGTVDLESWKTLQETMPLALQKTAEAMGYVGKSAQRDLYAALKDGTVTFDQFNDKLIELGTGTGMLAGLAKENSLGIATSFGNLRNAVAKNVANIITKFDEIAQKLTGKTIAQNIDGIKSIINDFGGFVVAGMDGIIPALEKVTNNPVFSTLSYWFTMIGNTAKESTGSLVESVSQRIPSIINYFTGLYESVKPSIEQIMATIYFLSDAVGEVFSTLIPPILDIAGAVWQKLSDAILPILTGIIDAVAGFADSLTAWITDTALPALEDFFTYISDNKGIIDLLAGAIAAAGGAFLAFKGYLAITSLISGVSSAIGILTTAFTILSNVGIGGAIKMLAGFMGPVGWIITIIGAVIGVIVYLWNTNEGFRNAVISIWEAIKKAFVDAWEAIKSAWTGTKEWFSAIWQGIQDGVTSAVEGIKTAWDSVKEFFTTLWTTITTLATTAWTMITSSIMTIVQPFIDMFMNIWNSVSTGLSMIWQGIQMIAQGAWELIKNIVLTPVLLIVDLVTGDFESMGSHLSQIWANIQAAISMIWEGIKTYFSGVVSVIVGFVTAQFENLMSVLSGIWNAISSTAINTWNSLKSSIVNIANNIVSSITNAWESFKSYTANLWSSMQSLAVNTWNNIKSSVVNIVNGLVSGAQNAWNNLKQGVSDSVNNVKNIFQSLSNVDLFAIGQNIIQGLINGIGSMVNAVANKISEVASGIKDKITGALGIHSPSRWMRDQVGKYIPQGIAVGIEADANSVYRAMSKLSDGLMNTVTPEMALGVGNIGTASSVNQIVNNSYSNGNSNRGMIDAIVKLANRPAIFKQEVDKREFSRIFAEPINEEQATSESFKNMLNGVKPKR